jgi:hypothetical protein
MLDPHPPHRTPTPPRRTRIPVELVPPLLVAIVLVMIELVSALR